MIEVVDALFAKRENFFLKDQEAFQVRRNKLIQLRVVNVSKGMCVE